jgi:signal transduction histidine kinase
MGSPLVLKIGEVSSVENPSLELMMRHAFPELAGAVRGRSPSILERLRVVVKEVLPSADELTLTELLDHLPQALEDLAVALATKSGSLQQRFLFDSRQHGVCRFHQSFNLSELLVEYSILRSIVIEEVGKALKRAPTLDEISALNAGLDAASRRAVESFVVHQQHEVQAGAEAYGKYLSFLSHDLRGSLNGILLTVEVLRREKGASSERQEWVNDLEMMRRSILDTVSAMDRFLHADKFRRGKVEVKLGPVDLTRVISEIANQFAEQAREKGIEIVVEMQAASVVTDRELVQVILQNLVGNAVKYTQAGKVRIASASLEHGKCRITVADDGPGIPAEQLEKIFQPYMRGPTHGQSGLGLGLTIAHEAAVLLKGKLWAENIPGTGAKFHLDLPS